MPPSSEKADRRRESTTHINRPSPADGSIGKRRLAAEVPRHELSR
jgi:hypothetical protein